MGSGRQGAREGTQLGCGTREDGGWRRLWHSVTKHKGHTAMRVRQLTMCTGTGRRRAGRSRGKNPPGPGPQAPPCRCHRWCTCPWPGGRSRHRPGGTVCKVWRNSNHSQVGMGRDPCMRADAPLPATMQSSGKAGSASGWQRATRCAAARGRRSPVPSAGVRGPTTTQDKKQGLGPQGQLLRGPCMQVARRQG